MDLYRAPRNISALQQNIQIHESPLKSIENASADCLNATDMSPVNSATVNNIVIDDFLYEFIIAFIYNYMNIFAVHIKKL